MTATTLRKRRFGVREAMRDIDPFDLDIVGESRLPTRAIAQWTRTRSRIPTTTPTRSPVPLAAPHGQTASVGLVREVFHHRPFVWCLRSATGRSAAFSARTAVAGVALGVMAAGCSGGDGALSTIPTLPPTSSTPTSTGATPRSEVTTLGPATPSATTTTATPPATSTTLSPEQNEAAVRAEVERDFLAGSEVLWELASKPTKKDLKQRLSRAMIKNSPGYRAERAGVLDLVKLGERIRLDDPPVRKYVVERIELLREPPYSEAIITYCSVNNANRVVDLPGGEVGYVGTPQRVHATRIERPMRKTPDGWKQYALVDEYIGRWEGDRCREL